jgi:hypothetical protein
MLAFLAVSYVFWTVMLAFLSVSYVFWTVLLAFLAGSFLRVFDCYVGISVLLFLTCFGLLCWHFCVTQNVFTLKMTY